MEDFSQVLAAARYVVFLIGDFIIRVLSAVDVRIRADLSLIGMPGYQQTMIVASLTILVIIAAIRVLQGVARSAFILVLLLLVMRALMPSVQG